MKDFNPGQLGQDDKQTSADHRPIRKEQHMSGRLNRHPGHTVYEYDLKTDEIREAVIEKVSANMNIVLKGQVKPKVTIRHKIIQKIDHLYVSALNLTNAKKKFTKELDRQVKAGTLIKTD